MRRWVITIAIVGSLAAATRSAAADDRLRGTYAWGVASGEAASAGIIAIAFTTKAAQGPGWAAYALAPEAVALGVGYLAYREDLPATVPMIVHGGAWLGLDLFMIGSLIDGRHESTRMRIGSGAVTLGLIGTIGGGVLAGLTSRTKDADAMWLAGPPVGFFVGGLMFGGMMFLFGKLDTTKAASQFAWGAVVGATVGLGGAIIYGATHRDAGTGAARIGAMPQIELEPKRLVVSFGGAF